MDQEHLSHHDSHEHRAAAADTHDGHGGDQDHAAVFRRLFWRNLVLALPVVAFSPVIQDWFGYSPASFPGDDLVAPVLGTVIFFYGGWPFLTGGVAQLRSRRPGMMALISLAITVPGWPRSRPSSTPSRWTSGGSWPP